MAESKDNLGGATVRIPDWLADELEAEIARHPRGARPSRGDLLAGAWKRGKPLPAKEGEFPKSSLSTIDEISGPTVLSELTSGDVPVTPEEDRWITQLRYILQHGDAETVEAITRNLDRFSLLTRLINLDASARDEIDRLAGQVAADRERRVALFHQLDQRYRAGGTGLKNDETRAKKKKKSDPRETGTGGNH